MKRNKMLRLLSACLVVVLLLGACGGTGSPDNQPADATQEEVFDPAADGVLNILMVGNSFCYYYVEELYALLMENPLAGIEQVNVFNLYYSGCKLTQHLTWWNQSAANYDLYRVDATGRKKLDSFDKWTLEQALQMADWDYISYQGSPSGASYVKDDTVELSKTVATLSEPILARFHELFPKARLLWHRTWYSEIGRISDDGYIYNEEDAVKYNAAMEQVSRYMCEEFDRDKPYDLIMVNSGAAWIKARELNQTANVLPYGGLCARLGKNSFGDNREHSGDGYHDGDIGGAQLLNAYVWYMTITGNTDVSASAYEPEYTNTGITYTLEKEHIALLKEAAMSVFAPQ